MFASYDAQTATNASRDRPYVRRSIRKRRAKHLAAPLGWWPNGRSEQRNGKTPEKRFRIETESSNLQPLPSSMRRTICASNESAVAKRRNMYHG
ncbi:hypothetical protein [Burkholderia sp. Bp8963]|uniref:hypothetical protein n=1 Tax=Burkholderia sp. Bp8963 TaxID=2184547 RepID=UPI000F5A680D|nr:hypothetical protein [Burkholderia sp. Bp8963]